MVTYPLIQLFVSNKANFFFEPLSGFYVSQFQTGEESPQPDSKETQNTFLESYKVRTEKYISDKSTTLFEAPVVKNKFINGQKFFWGGGWRVKGGYYDVYYICSKAQKT